MAVPGEIPILGADDLGDVVCFGFALVGCDGCCDAWWPGGRVAGQLQQSVVLGVSDGGV